MLGQFALVFHGVPTPPEFVFLGSQAALLTAAKHGIGIIPHVGFMLSEEPAVVARGAALGVAVIAGYEVAVLGECGDPSNACVTMLDHGVRQVVTEVSRVMIEVFPLVVCLDNIRTEVATP